MISSVTTNTAELVMLEMSLAMLFVTCVEIRAEILDQEFESRSERLKIKVCVGCESRVLLVGLDMNYICTAGVTEMCSCHLLLKGSL